MTIDNLTISYPDFQLNQTIEPEQFDTNNLEIVTKINAIITSYNAITASKIPLVAIDGLTSTDVQVAIQSLKTLIDSHESNLENPHNVTPAQLSVYTKSELDPYLRGGDTVIRSETFEITNANNGDGTFSYKDEHDLIHVGILNELGKQVFTLLEGNYEINQNRIECIVNDTVHLNSPFSGMSELTPTTFFINPQNTGSKITVKYFERVGITGTGLIVVDTVAPPNGFMWYKVLP